jgi:signal transduction histidine kinase
MTIRANRNRLIQVLLNLLENAIDATALKTYPEGQHARIVLTGVVLPRVGELRVRDNGPGIPDEIRGKIFEPFFTTKEVGEGTGLGLSICHRLVSEMEGRIRVESKPGEGSEFTLEFPRGV